MMHRLRKCSVKRKLCFDMDCFTHDDVDGTVHGAPKSNHLQNIMSVSCSSANAQENSGDKQEENIHLVPQQRSNDVSQQFTVSTADTSYNTGTMHITPKSNHLQNIIPASCSSAKSDMSPNNDKPKRYKLRESSKKNYDEGDNVTEDFSPDCSEYIPSPERFITDSPVNSSFSGDSKAIENLMTNTEIRPSSRISNLSEILFSTTNNSPTDSLPITNTIPHTKNNKEMYPIQLIDIALKSQESPIIASCNLSPPKIDSVLSIVDYTLTADQSKEDLERTLTPNQNEKPINNLDLNITVTSSDKNTSPQSDIASCNLSPPKIDSVLSIVDYTLTADQSKEDLERTLTPNQNEKPINNLDLNITVTSSDKNTSPQSDKTSTSVTKYIKIEDETAQRDYDITITFDAVSPDADYEDVLQQVHQVKDDVRVHTLSVSMENVHADIVLHPEIGQHKSDIISKSNIQERSRNLLKIPRVAAIMNNLDEISILTETNNENNTIGSNSNSKETTPSTPPRRLLALMINDWDEIVANSDEDQDDCQESAKSKTLTRKRKRMEKKDAINKRLKNSGEAYESRNKKKRPKKIMLPSCDCKRRCGWKFSEEQRQSIHEKFYKFADRELQWQYIVRHVKREDVKRITLKRKNNRTQTLKYHFPNDEEEIQVCKVFFMSTLNITEQMIYTAMEKDKSDDGVTDNRGKHLNRPHRMKPSTEASIMTHINMFPAVESHYTRKHSKRQYLPESLNISKMYRFYTEWFPTQNYTDDEDVKMATKRQYETVFNTKFNYSFFKPKKDQCALCAKYEQCDPSEKVSLEENHRIHLKRKERIREIKNLEKETSDKNTTVIAIYDLQKVLSIPQSEVSVFHYKRKYPVYNFTVFDALNRHGYCYTWHAQIGKKGCTEIGSCLWQFIMTEHARGIRKFLFYSDGCYGQNKNRYIFALYLFAAIRLGLEITHKFFVTGHSQNEGDSMHACIEKNINRKVLYTPDQIYSNIINAKVTGQRYKLKEMEQSEIFNIKDLVVPSKWTHDKKGEKVRWSDVMEVCVSHEKSNCFFFKYDFDEEYSELDIQRRARGRGRGRGRITPPVKLIDATELKPAYTKMLPVNKKLYNDLQSLCSTNAIPRNYHGFYQSLTYKNDSESDGQESDDSN